LGPPDAILAIQDVAQTQVACASATRLSREPSTDEDKYCRLTQIFLFGAGTVLEIVAAGGIKEYLNQISTPEGAAKLFEILHLERETR
jgi:hypothetical protein